MAARTAVGAYGADVALIPPPLYYGVGLGLGLAIDGALPWPVDGRPATAVAGVLATAAGVVLAAGGVAGVVGHRTTIVPHHPVAALVTDGAYRWSRNPMYAGLAAAYLGVALLAGSWWPVVLWPVVMTAVHRLVVAPEERYLRERFGAAYADYCRRVRRWV